MASIRGTIMAALLTLAPGVRLLAQAATPGTYTVLICRDGCGARDTLRAYLVGQIVIERQPFKLTDLPADTRPHFEFAFMVIGDSDSVSVGGCFALRRRHPQPDSYAGPETVGLLDWYKGPTERFSLVLVRSPDAGYYMALRSVGEELRGYGASWGARFVEIHAPRDSILAWKAGPPDRQLCIDAARRRQR